MKTILIITCLALISLKGYSQNYLAVYHGTYYLKGETFEIITDSTISTTPLLDSLFKVTLKERNRSKIEFIMDLQTCDTFSLIESKILQTPSFVNISVKSSLSKIAFGNIYNYNSRYGRFELDSGRHQSNYILTGNSKNILGYKSEEAISVTNAKEKIFICRELPGLVTPGILTNFSFGVLEFITPDYHYILESLSEVK
jgi:hypothetical protein